MVPPTVPTLRSCKGKAQFCSSRVWACCNMAGGRMLPALPKMPLTGAFRLFMSMPISWRLGLLFKVRFNASSNVRACFSCALAPEASPSAQRTNTIFFIVWFYLIAHMDNSEIFRVSAARSRCCGPKLKRNFVARYCSGIPTRAM